MKSTRTVLYGFVFLFCGIDADGPKARRPGCLRRQLRLPQRVRPLRRRYWGRCKQEMDREMAVFGKADPPAYFLSYTVTDSDRAEVTGSNGALLSSQQQRSRWLEGQVRVGSYQLDDTHHVGNRRTGAPGSFGEAVPIDDDAGVLKRAMWRETDGQYRAAAEAFIKVKTGKDVQVQTVAQGAPDFSRGETASLLRSARFVHRWIGIPGKTKYGCTRLRSGSRRRF